MELVHVSFSKVYRFKSILFEWHSYCGPLFLRRKDMEPKNEQQRPMRDYGLLSKWCNMSKTKQEQYRVY